MRDAVGAGLDSAPNLTCHLRPRSSSTWIFSEVPDFERSTKVNLPFGSGAPSAPPGPLKRSRLSRSVGSCHSTGRGSAPLPPSAEAFFFSFFSPLSALGSLFDLSPLFALSLLLALLALSLSCEFAIELDTLSVEKIKNNIKIDTHETRHLTSIK